MYPERPFLANIAALKANPASFHRFTTDFSDRICNEKRDFELTTRLPIQCDQLRSHSPEVMR